MKTQTVAGNLSNVYNINLEEENRINFSVRLLLMPHDRA
jgi:hypothetical protein